MLLFIGDFAPFVVKIYYQDIFVTLNRFIMQWNPSCTCSMGISYSVVEGCPKLANPAYMLPILFCQYHASWCPGNFRSQGTSRHGIDQIHQSESPLVEAMAWCCQATSQYLPQCWSHGSYKPGKVMKFKSCLEKSLNLMLARENCFCLEKSLKISDSHWKINILRSWIFFIFNYHVFIDNDP